MRAIFLYTKLFSGPDQFIIQLVFVSILSDLFFTLYCPFSWINASIKGRWAGWGKGTSRTDFKYVRKPDPQEELKRKGYFRKRGRFSYVSRGKNTNKLMLKNKTRSQPSLIFDPCKDQASSFNAEKKKRRPRKIFVSKESDQRRESPVKELWEETRSEKVTHLPVGDTAVLLTDTDMVNTTTQSKGRSEMLDGTVVESKTKLFDSRSEENIGKILCSPNKAKVVLPVYMNQNISSDPHIIIHNEPTNRNIEKILKIPKEINKEDKDKFLTDVRTIGESRIPKKKNQEEGNIEIFGIN